MSCSVRTGPVAEAGDGYFDVGPTEEFPEGTINRVVVNGTELVVIRQEGELFCLPDMCTHQRYPLHDGELEPGKVRCFYHGATFDLRTGRATLPAVKKIQLYTAVERDGRVLVSLQER